MGVVIPFKRKEISAQDSNLINKLIHIRSSDSNIRLKVALKIIEMTNHRNVKYITDLSEIKSNDMYYLFGSSLRDDQIDKLNINIGMKRDLQAVVFDVDRIPNAQQTSTDVLQLLFFKFDSLEVEFE